MGGHGVDMGRAREGVGLAWADMGADMGGHVADMDGHEADMGRA